FLIFFSDSQNDKYGVANPCYAPAATGTAAMLGPPTAESYGPSAPPATMFDSMPGYEGTVAGGGGFLPPPMPAYPGPQPTPGPEQPNWNIPSISEDTAREAFMLFASSKCCYSSAPAKDGVIINTEAFNTYRYRLETFTESRSTEWRQEPYSGQTVDAYAQPPPGSWDIPANSPSLFVDGRQCIRVPYTSSLKVKLRQLCGNGEKTLLCNGYGFRIGFNRCYHCNGRGRENCNHCNGQGSRMCEICNGKRQFLVFKILNVKWTNNIEDYIVEQCSGLQLKNLRKVSGKELLKESQPMVEPVMGFPDPNVVQASQRLVNEHQGKYRQTSRILRQRQTIELIPVTKVAYTWKEETHIYFVYGNELKVSADNYPATCCCSVM
uniref:Ssu-2 homolog, related sequence 1 n=1 Tax=Oryzias latipes TaxID=8090 RepID=A0A3B3HAH4_ORYLA